MRDMPLALAWFLGSIFMLAGVLGGWVLRRAGRRNAASLAERCLLYTSDAADE